MVNHAAKLCSLLENCDVGCVVLTAKYSAFCHPEQDNERGVFIAPMQASRKNREDYKCKWQMDIDFLIAPFIKCSLDELNQIMKTNGQIKGGLVEVWEMLGKIKECIKCENDYDSCDEQDPFFVLDRILTPDCCGAHVVLPTVWRAEYYC